MVRYRELITFNMYFSMFTIGTDSFSLCYAFFNYELLRPLELPGNDAQTTKSRLSDLGGPIYRDPY